MDKKRNPDNILIQKYLIRGFRFKIICALFYALLIYFYYGIGDSINYFKDVLSFRQLISNGTEDLGILFTDFHYPRDVYGFIGAGNEGGWLVEKMALLLSYLSFSKFLITTMLFATIAYSGMFKMLEVFVEIMPEWHQRIAFFVLFFPSVCIYGSGILKDTVCIASMGWMLYAGNQIFVKKHFSLKYIFILVLCIVLIYVVKIYIIVAFIVPYIFYLLLRLVKKINSTFIRRVVLPLLVILLAFAYMRFADNIDSYLGKYATEKIFNTVKEQQTSYLTSEEVESGSTFDIGAMEPTLSGFIKKMPAGIVATLFRPFLWESRKIIMLVSALESLLILLFTLYVFWRAGIFTFFKQLFKNPFIFLCISYSLIFASLVGVSTLNFGTLARYRIPIIPFYLTGLLAILYYVKILRVKKPHESVA